MFCNVQVSGSRNRAYFEQCGFRTMETVDVCSEVRALRRHSITFLCLFRLLDASPYMSLCILLCDALFSTNADRADKIEV